MVVGWEGDGGGLDDGCCNCFRNRDLRNLRLPTVARLGRMVGPALAGGWGSAAYELQHHHRSRVSITNIW